MESVDLVSSDILKCSSTIDVNDRTIFILELCKRDFVLLNLLIEYRNDLNTDEDKKTHKIVTYLLTKIYKLDTNNFNFVGVALGLVAADP